MIDLVRLTKPEDCDRCACVIGAGATAYVTETGLYCSMTEATLASFEAETVCG